MSHYTATRLRPRATGRVEACPDLLQQLLDSSIVPEQDWEHLPAHDRFDLWHCNDSPTLFAMLVNHGLLTQYQADRASTGDTFGMILGDYRILDPLHKGSMSLVYRGEHRRSRQEVAIKVLPARPPSAVLKRFRGELRAIAQLNHPNIVRGLDSGQVGGPENDSPVVHYYAMEYVEGHDLEELVSWYGPLPAAFACKLAYQVASALAEADKHELIHRDVKPTNVMVDADDQAKLIDFGLVRDLQGRLTKPKAILGTLDYMAPEQAMEARSVDIRTDIYALGGTLFWSLTGRMPFKLEGSFVDRVMQRRLLPAPSVCHLRPEVSADVDRVISRMMALCPDDRYPTPRAVMTALSKLV